MFKKFKDKLKDWKKNISKEQEKTEEPEKQEKIEESEEKKSFLTKITSKFKTPEESIKEPEKRIGIKEPEERIKETKEKIGEKTFIETETSPKGKIKDEIKESKEEKASKKEKEIIEELEIPSKFDVAKQKYEPDLEKLDQEIKEKSLLQKITSKISTTKISEDDFNKYSEDLEMLLLENNVALEVAEKIIKDLKEKIIRKEIPKKEIEKEITNSLKEIINEILIEPFNLIEEIKNKKDSPYVILFCGINGTGKTTTTAKIANHLKEQNISCVISASDTFRAASIEQIKKHGEKIGVEVITHDYGSDPSAVGFDAIKYASKNKIKCVLIDTAGRIHTAKNLMREMEKIVRICKPDTKIFVAESITGNDAIEQLKAFDETIKIDGTILSKADIDEKGGTAISIGYLSKKPILYLGTGQEYKDIELFDKEKFIGKLGL